MMRQHDVNKAVDFVIKCLLKAADIAIPKSSGNILRLYKPWWNDNCNAAKKAERRAWDKSRRYPTTTNRIAFKRAKSFFRKIRRQSKNGSFQKYVSSIQGHLSSKRMWEKVGKILGTNKSYQGISFLQTNGQFVSHT
ncbi:hypothetical protein AVEN_120313-1 [Araneus ventricosus]|uniref:Uncharacterized protein n=1 Tax=Araneus ventricosus TaxID=182803 RepID=A0A4Y2R973_ARAVE|nr:hypothetical protein AVEN_120313-1 [Araneus ventricosus]